MAEFDRYLEENAIRRILTTKYTSEQNGVVETKNRDLVEIARCLLLQMNLPQDFSAESVKTKQILHKWCQTKGLNGIDRKFTACWILQNVWIQSGYSR